MFCGFKDYLKVKFSRYRPAQKPESRKNKQDPRVSSATAIQAGTKNDKISFVSPQLKRDRAHHPVVNPPRNDRTTYRSPETNGEPKSLIGEVISSIQPQRASDIRVSPMIPTQPSTNEQTSSFTGAHDFVMMHPSFYADSRSYNYIMNGQPVLERLRSAGTPEAGLNAAARYPLPRCHPSTRKSIQEKLFGWLFGAPHKWKMVWLFGPAGVGKSAVAQTFAEAAQGQRLLAASYFFSSTQGEKRSDPLRIIPTLAYQMAIHSDHYKNVITQKLASDPSILDATLEAQFRGLVEDPFLQLASHEVQPFAESFHVVVIDGLDECNNDEAQCQLVELIKEAAQKTHLPLLWLICSRPERHLKSTFSRLEYAHVCRREELVINEESHADVERFMRARFREVHHKYRDTISVGIDSPWPTEHDLAVIMEQVSGHFVVASVAERYVGDPFIGDPEAQLRSLLSMLRGLSKVGTNNPLEALDAFYYRILSKVSESALPVVTRVLALLSYDLNSIGGGSGVSNHRKLTIEELWLFLRTDQPHFYSVMQRLHSVVDIPPPEDASNRSLTFYHKSFPDYLTSSHRSGKFFVSQDQARQCQLACSLHWYNLILRFQNPTLVMANEHQDASSMVNAWFRGIFHWKTINEHSVMLARNHLYGTVPEGNAFDLDLFNVLHDFDFRLMLGRYEHSDDNILPMFTISLALDTRASPHFVRTEVEDEIVDPNLLHHLSVLTQGKYVEPLDLTATDPFNDMTNRTVRFVIVGNGSKSGLACIGKGLRAKGFTWAWQAIWLNAALPPTSEQKLRFRKWEKEITVSRQGE
ncbi:hypothetical protein D9756_004588 [Leucocoprinus leucothites]|uniref:Nephrocystin 3-like N-terminal domain-containing protein n=1 Tax=Leucocoprinus leucothites TaxID=201217 RepID=A0A8H5G8M8_9AGAR|nr:hypothetical protein D9756_004588 [Leucoagaricus leucothites]